MEKLLKLLALRLLYTMSSLTEFIECLDCGFVTYSRDGRTPTPKGREACPDCGSTRFDFTNR